MQQAFEDMSPAERIRHVQDLWDRISARPEDVPVTGAMKAELDRRLAEHQAAPADVIPWEELKARSRPGK